MAIQFSCPNGHKLSCPDDRAGRSGKCPKCSALFRVPTPEEVAASVASNTGDSSVGGNSGVGSGIGSGIGGAVGGSGIGGSGIAGNGLGSGIGGSGIGGSGFLGGGIGGSGIGPGSDTYPNFTGSGSGVVGGGGGSGTSLGGSSAGSGLMGGGDLTLSSLGIGGGSATGTAPAPESAAMPSEVTGSGGMEVVGGSSSKITEQIGSSPNAGGDQIVFLCPNGHKLNGPASLQGRPGKCPHCGAKFLIPDYSAEEDEDDEIDSDMERELLGGDEEAAEETAQAASASNAELPFNLEDLQSFTGVAPTYQENGHAMARLFSQIWRDKGQNGIVEIFLKAGGVVAPHWFAPRHSEDTFGMFGMQDVDGSYSLAVIKWDAIERVSVRGLEDFPEGMFTEDGT